ncbi:MAG: hypothetical protein ABSB49_14560, partial [Polyangia bacterium]
MPVVGHVPVESQVSAVLPLHFWLSGVQTAPHCPAVMVPLAHSPWLSQVCGVVPEHCAAFGAHTPAQAP